MNGIGTIFPKTHKNIALNTPIPNKEAATNPPLNSKIGTIDIINTTSSFGIKLNVLVNQLINESVIICSLYYIFL
ncbi:hypothetical protein SDC9_78242 [bioreactor metagenome]|uniref:Uncharacterized protein n=1 Tax=bioreactor metagenome TaxID=1076179 RepID=A0A644YSY6_9ZZZZ